MNIVIIGAGQVCQALAAALSHAGHSVTIASRDAGDAAKAAAALGVRAADSTVAAVSDADIVILATPFDAFEEIAAEIGDAAAGKVVVDVSNPMAGWDDAGPIYEGGAVSGAEHLQQLLPRSRVAKAFNTAFAHYQANPVADGQAVDGFVAADDPDAKAIVLELVRSAGFRQIDAGPLRHARELEAMGSLMMALSVANGWHNSNAWKVLGVAEFTGG